MQALETCDESVVKKWRDCEERRQLLVVHITDLRRHLINFSESPVAREILMRTEARAQIRADLERMIRAERGHIQWRMSALTDARASMEIAQMIKKSERRLQSLTELNAPAVILENERRLIWHCAAPITELEESLKPRELELAYCRQEIENIEEEYRAAKRASKTELGKAEMELAQIIEAQRHWVSADRDRLSWILTHQAHRGDEMIRAFHQVHPGDALGDLVHTEEPTKRSRPSARLTVKKPRRAPSVASGAGQGAPDPPAAADQRLWTLVYTNDPPTREYPIARRWRQAVSTLDELLQHQRLAVSPTLLLKKLTEVTHLPIQRRQGLKCVLGQDLHGWKIIRVGEYRALLDVNEEKRTIRFLVRPRKDAYGR